MMLRIFRFCAQIFLRIFHAVQYKGTENVPKTGRCIIASNHPTFFDPIVISLALERWVGFFALKQVIDFPIFGRVARIWGSLPVVPAGDNEPSVQKALRRLKEGKAVGIFPEGRRSKTKYIDDVRPGVGRMAAESGAIVVPATIFGADKVWPYWMRFPQPGKIVVVFHKPLKMKEGESHIDFANRIREVILRSQLEPRAGRVERRRSTPARRRESDPAPAGR